MIIENNFKFLSDNVKNIIKNTEEFSVEYRINRDNIKIPFYKKVSLHSLYNPFGENRDFIYKENQLVISLGFGAGYHLINLLKKYKEVIVVLFEFDIFKSIISNIDLTLFFNEKELKIITLQEIIDAYDFFKYDSYIITYPISYERIFGKIILENIREIKNLLNNKILDINTQKKFGKIWHKNILKNIKNIDKFNYDPIIINKPILITGAGYSLIQNIELIKKFRNYLYIAATDTSLKILDSYEVNPDSVFTFDCQHWTIQHFLCLKNYNFRLFMDFTCFLTHPKIDKITLLFSNHPFSNFFSKYGNILRIDSSMGNIGAATIDFFYNYFKEIPIITCGIDYGIYHLIMYPKESSVKILNLVKSNFFNTIDNLDLKILYKYNIIEKEKDWCSNSVLKTYGELCKKNSFYKEIFTLSDSPFLVFKKIENLKNFLDSTSIKEKKIEIQKIEIEKDIYSSLSFFLNQSQFSLYPYFFAVKREPSPDLIKNLIEDSIDFLKRIE